MFFTSIDPSWFEPSPFILCWFLDLGFIREITSNVVFARPVSRSCSVATGTCFAPPSLQLPAGPASQQRTLNQTNILSLGKRKKYIVIPRLSIFYDGSFAADASAPFTSACFLELPTDHAIRPATTSPGGQLTIGLPSSHVKFKLIPGPCSLPG